MVGGAGDTTGALSTGGPPDPSNRFAQLEVRAAGQTVRTVPVTGELRIGRGHDNDLVVDGSGVDGYHAHIYPRDGGLFLSSDGTTTTVNGIILIGRRRLCDGDRIGVGDTLLIYHAALYPASEAPDEEDHAAFLMALQSTLPPLQTGKRRRPRLPWQAEETRAPDGRQRSPTVVPTPAGLLVLVAIAAIVAYLVAPDSFEIRRTNQQLTPVIAASAPGPVITARSSPMARNEVAGESVNTISPPTSATPDDLAAFLLEAERLTLHSQFGAAIARYQELAEQAERDARVQAGWSRALILDGDVEQGLIHAEEATTLDPDRVEGWIALTRAYVAAGNASGALSAGRKAVDLAGGADSTPGDEDRARAHAMLAEAYLLGGLLPQAVEHAEMAMDHFPRIADALSVRGRLYLLADGNAEAAVTALRGAAALEPELWVRHQELGLMLLDLEQYRPAIDAFTQAMVLCHKPATYTALGRAYYHLGEYDQGKSYLEQSLSLGTDDVQTYALLAVMNAKQGRCDDARVYYDQAFERDLAHPLALQAQEVCETGAIPAGTDTPPASGTSATAGAPTSTAPEHTATPEAAPTAPYFSGWIAFSAWNTALGHYDTYVARPDGSDRRLVATQMHQPAFRPDGEWLAVNGERPLHMNIHVVRLSGGDPIEISTYLEDRLPRWSHDGKALIYSSTRHPDRQPRLYVVDDVPFDGRRAQDQPVRGGLYEVLGDYPAWLPDGRIVYTGCDWSTGAAQCGLLAVSSTPGTQTPQVMTDYPGDTAPTAGPDGQIAFMSDRDGNWEVYLLTLNGSVRRLTQHAANDGLPAWSPGGDYVAFVSDRGGAWAVWVMRPDGSGQSKLFDLGEGGLAVDWQYESISWGR